MGTRGTMEHEWGWEGAEISWVGIRGAGIAGEKYLGSGEPN